jgi:hypothetical protein
LDARSIRLPGCFWRGHCAGDRARRPRASGNRRYPDQTLWSRRPGCRHPSQSHAGACRPEVSLQPHLGNTCLAGTAPVLGMHRFAVAHIMYVRQKRARAREATSPLLAGAAGSLSGSRPVRPRHGTARQGPLRRLVSTGQPVLDLFALGQVGDRDQGVSGLKKE